MKTIKFLFKSELFLLLTNLFKKDKNILSMVIVGSYARFGIGNDLDIILIVKRKNYIKKIINKIKKIKFNSKLIYNLDVFRIKDPFLKKEISFFIISKFDFKKSIDSIIKGELEKILVKKTNWAIGGYFPELFLYDIFTAKIIFDKDKLLDKYKKKLSKFPEKFRISVIKDFKNELINKFNKKSKFKLINELIKIDIKLGFLRSFFALNKVYLFEFKHIFKLIKKYNNRKKFLKIVLNIFNDKYTINDINKLSNYLFKKF